MSSKDIIWRKLRISSKTVEHEIDPLERKRTGSYYTDLLLTDVMMKELVSKLVKMDKPIYENRFLEPCVGTENFVFSYLKAVGELALSKAEMEKVIDNIYVADINKKALNEYKRLLTEFVSTFWDIVLLEPYFETHIGSGLLIDVTADALTYTAISDIFSKNVVKDGFDIVVTNPPYKNLKAERNQYSDNDTYEMDRKKYEEASKIVSKRFFYSTDGILNLYKLFVEEIIDRYANKNAYISLLIPSSILSDKTCEKLRTHILLNENLLSVKVIREDSGYIEAQQALAALLIQKGQNTELVHVVKDYCNAPEDVTLVARKDIINPYTGNAIVAVSKEEYKILQKLRSFPVVKELPFVINLRGELDLTTNKKYIISDDTGYRLIRGRNIGYYSLIDTEEYEFVNKTFIDITKKKEYIFSERIICQQIANMNKERRVTFAFVPKNYILGNSCNFITVKENPYGITTDTLLGLFNTNIINWLFKLTSSNNHINNYEIDSFPIPVNSKELGKVTELVKSYKENMSIEIVNKIETYALLAYGLI